MLHSDDPPEEFDPLTREDPSAFSPPPAFGPFRVLHQIGIGALGPVFRTYEPARDRLVAVKVFRLDIVPEQAHALADALGRATQASLFHPSTGNDVSPVEFHGSAPPLDAPRSPLRPPDAAEPGFRYRARST